MSSLVPPKTGALPCALPTSQWGTRGSPRSLSLLLFGLSQVWMWDKTPALHYNAGISFAGEESGSATRHQRKVTVKWHYVYVCHDLNSSLPPPRAGK